MTPGLPRNRRALGALVVVLALAGCESPQHAAREEATQRWNTARAQIKAKFAADQFAAGNVPAAANDLAEVDRLEPDNPALVPLRARIWLSEGKLTAAAELLERTHLEGKAQAEIEYLLGVARQQQQRSEEALAAFERATVLDGENVAYVVAAAQTEMQLRRPRAALDRLQEVEPQFDWTPAYQATLAECFEQLRDWPAAAAAWRRIAAGPDAVPDSRRRLGEALYRAGRYADVISVLNEALELDSGAGEGAMRLMLAECYLATGRDEAARVQAQLVAQREGQNVRALRLLARALAAGGEYAPALRVAQQALALDTQDGLTLELATALAWRAGDRDLAAASAAQLLRIDPANVAARQVLQQVHVSAVGDKPE